MATYSGDVPSDQSSWAPFRRFDGTEGWPGGGGLIRGFAFPLLANAAMQGTGMTPMGVSERNLLTRLQDQRFTMMHDEMVSQAARLDQDSMMRLTKGIASIAGVPWREEQMRAAMAFSGNLVKATPWIAQVPGGLQFLDIMGGQRGSAVAMADYMARASRYRIDPVTGQMGMDVASARAMITGTYQELFAGERFRTAGLSMGQTGQLGLELFRRGMLPGGQIGLDDLTNLPRGRRDELLQMPEVQTRIRELDSRRVSQTLEQWSQAVRAMKDIFGEAGRPDAPMSELINALNTLSAGGMGQLDPARITQMVRQTANLARESGIGLQGALMLQQAASMRAAEMGINPLFAAEAVQGSLAFGAAFRGLGMGAYPAWGRSQLPRLMEMDQNLRLGAAASISANQMGLALRLNEVNAFAPGTEAAAFVQAIRAGAPEFVGAGGVTRSVEMREMEFARMIEAGAPGRMTVGTTLRMLQQTAANREFAFKEAAVVPLVRGLQTGTVTRMFTNVMQSVAMNRLAVLDDLGGMAVEPLAQALGETGARTFMGLSTAVATDRAKRNQAMADSMMETLNQLAESGDPAAQAMLARGDISQLLPGLAEDLFGETDIWSRRWRRVSLMDTHALFNRQIGRATGMQRARSQTEAMMQTAIAPLGTGGMMRRGIQAIMDLQPGDPSPVMNVVSKAFGGVSGEEMAKVVGNQRWTELQSKISEYKQAAERWQQAAPEDRADRWSDVEAKAKALGQLSREVGGMLQSQGFFTSTLLKPEDLARYRRHSIAMDQLLASEDASTETIGDHAEQGQQNVRDLQAQFLGDPATVERMGREGLRQIGVMRGASRELYELATSKGMSLGQLYASQDPDLRAKVKELRARQAGAQRYFYENIYKTRRTYDYLGRELRTDLGDIVAGEQIEGVSTVRDLLQLTPATLRKLAEQGILSDKQLEQVQEAQEARGKFLESYETHKLEMGESGTRALQDLIMTATGMGREQVTEMITKHGQEIAQLAQATGRQGAQFRAYLRAGTTRLKETEDPTQLGRFRELRDYAVSLGLDEGGTKAPREILPFLGKIARGMPGAKGEQKDDIEENVIRMEIAHLTVTETSSATLEGRGTKDPGAKASETP